jgi:prepilin-type N-terminal cleavage/methylation domain-containing protein
MKRVCGFTLVELLVVIAIISILAAIVTPRVGKFILKAQVARAQEEIHSLELALTDLLTDAQVRDFKHMFPSGAWNALAATNDIYGDVFYELLRQGREAPIATSMREEVRLRLGTSYLDIGKDPWGNLYRVYPGPWRRSSGEPIPFRSYRGGVGDLDGGIWTPYVYDAAAKSDLDSEIPGNPDPDDRPGYPAPLDYTFYIYSFGPNMLDDQDWGGAVQMGYEGGGDDINNWDSEAGWTAFSG